MKHGALLRKISVVGVSAACCIALVGCGGTNYGYTGGVAATVNGAEIQEDTITKYIQDFRTSSDLTSDDDWGNWMKENSFDPATVRDQVIDYYVENKLKKQACDEKGITVEQSQVDDEINNMKANYDSDDAWKQALSSAGLTEDQYRESVEAGLLDKALEDAVAGDAATADDSKVLDMLNTYYTMFNGAKKSSHILFASGDTEKAQEVLDQINAGTLDFAEAAKQYSTDTASAADGGNVGWDAINSFVTDYTDALDGLSVGQVSGLVTSDYGIHIIKCTDEFSCDGNATSLSAYPQEFIDYISNIVKDQSKSTAYSNWFNDYKAQADIQNSDMPENVPYNLDMTKYDNNDSSSDNSDGSSNGASADTNADASATEGSSESSNEQSSDSENSGQ